LHLLSIPNWLKVRIGKAEVKHILNGVLSKKMTDPKHTFFRECTMNYFIQGMGRSPIVAKWPPTAPHLTPTAISGP